MVLNVDGEIRVPTVNQVEVTPLDSLAEGPTERLGTVSRSEVGWDF